MRIVGSTCLVLALLTSCRDTTLPPPPLLGPGSVRATVLTTRPGRAALEPAVGATVTLVGTTQHATADADGNLLLSNVLVTKGRLLFALDVDGDGVTDQSRLISLEAVEAGFGRDVNLGQLILSRNATLTGTVLRGDRATLPSGHGGINVFLPELPQLTWSGDDGSFELTGVPEGDLALSFFSTGYAPQAVALSVGAGQEVRVARVVLDAAPGASAVGRLTGAVRRVDDDSPIAAVQVRAATNGLEYQSQTTAEGGFALETLPTGVYSLALQKQGLAPLRLDGVLVAAGLNDVGTLRLGDGVGTITLDGGFVQPDAGTTDAGTTDAGTTDAGTTDAGTTDAGTTDAGATDAGPTDAGPTDAGTPDAGPTGPWAVVGPPTVVARNGVATLDGTGSTGDFPLSYRWTQVSGPAVVLSANGDLTAHSPTFTAPATPQLLEFALVVTDRNGVSSTNTALARVSVSSLPVARFVPDGGLVFGGQALVVQSTSFDDGGVLLVSHDWRLTSGSAATLSSDGGPQAQLTFSPLVPGDADRLARLELQVTNAVGATSPVFTRDFTVRALASTNWSITITPLAAINVGASPPSVNLTATLSLPTGAAAPSVAWSCSPARALVGANSLTPSFVAPVVTGTTAVTCTVVATGAAPLVPSVQSAQVVLTFNDTRAPSVSSVEQPSRGGPWGRSVRFSEPLPTANTQGTGCTGGTQSYSLFAMGSWGVPNLGAVQAPGTCAGYLVTGSDGSNNTLPATDLGGVSTDTVWEGPFLSTAQFDDPRPVLASLGQVPEATYDLFGTQGTRAPGLELFASEPGSVTRFTIDPFVADAGCPATGCTLSGTALPVPWIVSGAVPISRTHVAGDSMFTAFVSDAGVALLERRADGTLSGPLRPPGQHFTSRLGAVAQLDAVSFESDAGALDRWRWDPSTRQWNRADRVVSGLPSVQELTGNELEVGALVGASRTLTVWTYGVSPAVGPTPAWHNVPTPTSLSSAPAMRNLQAAALGWSPYTVYANFYSRADNTLGLYRWFDTQNAFSATFNSDRSWGGSAVPIGGYDWVTRGGVLIGVREESGAILLSTLTLGAMGSPVSSTPFGGPSRPGPGPYPAPLNTDLACEGAHPRLAMVNDRLFITWQERCVPETRWRVALRVVR